MRIFSIFFFFLLLSNYSLSGQNIFSLDDIIIRSREQSVWAKQVETRKETRYWQYRNFKSRYNPQLSLQGTLPTYYKRVNQISQPNGTFKYIPVQQTNNDLSLGLFQPIAVTGGFISMNSSLGFIKDFNDLSSFGEQWSGNVMNIRLTQPLFAFNSFAWDKKTEPLRYEESKREYVEQLEGVSGEAVNRYFSVLEAQINLQIARFNLANNDTIYKIEEGRYNIGTTSRDKLLQVELQLLLSRQQVAQASLALETAKLQLRNFIGLKGGGEFELELPELIPEFEVSADEALTYARQYRSDYLAFSRRKIEADRNVADARGQRFQTNLTAAYGLNNNGFAVNEVYSNPQEMQQISITLGVPILDWGRNKSRMRTAIANKQLNDYAIAQEEETFDQEVITQAKQFVMLRSQIEISKKADEVATERYNVAQNRYLIGKIDITDLSIALTQKDDAKRSYILALRSFWTAYYALRMMTLYDFKANQPLYVQEK